MKLDVQRVLSIEDILKHVSEYDILHRAWPPGIELRLDKGAIISPFRNESTPSLLIGVDSEGKVRYKDLGNQEYKGGNVWQFLQHLYGLKSINEAMQWVDRSFNLGYGSGNVITGKPEVITWKQPEVAPKKPTLLQVAVRKFNKEELAYWNSYHQDISDLKREQIYAPSAIWRNRSKLPITMLTFCYYIPPENGEPGRWKIYRPHAPKRTMDTPPHEWKWDNSIGKLDYIENINKMVGPVGIMTKSRKDRMVIRKATGIDAICSIQNEDPAALTDEMLYNIWSNVGYKVVCMDNDEKGKSMSWHLSNRGYNHVNVPDRYLVEKITDMADWARVYGIEAVRNHMKEKWVI